jgi:hypothetical protein
MFTIDEDTVEAIRNVLNEGGKLSGVVEVYLSATCLFARSPCR